MGRNTVSTHTSVKPDENDLETTNKQSLQLIKYLHVLVIDILITYTFNACN